MIENEAELRELVDRWEDRREIQNLMSRYTYALLMMEERSIYEDYWCQNRADISLGLNDGFYVGRIDVRGYYEALHRKTLLRTSLIRQDFSEKADEMGLDEEALYGCGVLEHKPLGNQIIEIAGDRQTAKGFWYVVGKQDEYGIHGPLSYWTFGMFGADFVWEDGMWRIWHLMYVEDVRTPCGESWAAPPKNRPEIELYRPLEEFAMPPFSVTVKNHSLYSPERPFTKSIQLPEPYGTFAETFSYGR